MPTLSIVLRALPWLALAPTAAAVTPTFGGYIHYDQVRFRDDNTRPADRVSYWRRVDPILQLKGERWNLRLMPELTRDENKLLDAYVAFDIDKDWTLTVGRTKPPISLDRLKSSNAITFVESSLVGELAPNRDNGLMLGWKPGKHWQVQAGVFDGAPDGEIAHSPDAGAELVGHVQFKQPLLGGRWRVGATGSSGDRKGSLADPRLGRFRTPGRESIFRYRGDAIADGRFTRAGAYSDWYRGPAHLQLETLQSRHALRRGGSTASLDHRAWELQGGWVLTGEDASFDAIAPARPLFGGKGGIGAVQVAARIGRLDADGDAFPFYANPGTAWRRARSHGVTLNWWPNRHVRLGIDYERTRLDAAPGGTDRREDVLLTRIGLVY